MTKTAVGAARAARQALGLAAAAAAFFVAADRTPAQAAVLDLTGGAVVEGDVVAFGERYVGVATALGYQIFERGALRAIEIAVYGNGQTGDGRVSGRLIGWRGGMYQLLAGDGRVWVAREGGVAASAAPTASQGAETGLVFDPAAATQAGGAVAGIGAEAAEQAATLSLADPLIQQSIVEAVETAAAAWSEPPRAAAVDPSPAPSAPAATREAPPTDVRAALQAVIFGSDAGAAPDAERLASASMAALELGRATPSAQQPAARAPLRAAYLSGVAPTAHSRRSADPMFCARVAGVDGPLGAPATPGRDRDALVIGVETGYSAGVAAALTQVYYAAAGLTPDVSRPNDPATALWIAGQSPISAVTRPARVSARVAPAARLGQDLRGGLVDMRLGRGADADSFLIGFEPIVVAAHPEIGLPALTLDALRALLTGEIAALSDLGSPRDGVPTIYLPPAGSHERENLRALLGVSAMTPVAAVDVADPAARAAAAAADPNGLALTPAALTGRARRVPLGFTLDAAAAPDLEAIRAGRYPLVRPVYLELGDAAARHPLSAAFARFAHGEDAAAALRRVGVLPVRDCRDGSCRLSAPGLSAALSRADLPDTEMHRAALAQPGMVASAAVLFPGGADAPTDAAVAAVADLIAEQTTALAAAGGVVVRAAPAAFAATGAAANDPALAEAARRGAMRAEAMALALRCAGVPVIGATRPQGAPASVDVDWRVELLTRR